MSTTLAAARSETAKRAQEFLQGTATSGSTTTVVDANNLNHVDGYWAEALVLATSGTNSGLQRRVQTFTASSQTLTMYSAFTGAVASGMTYEIYRRFSPGDVDTAINRALNVGSPDFREKVRAVATATTNTLQYAFPRPSGVDLGALKEINYQYYTDSSQADWPYTKVSQDQYEVIEDYDPVLGQSTKTLQLRFNPATNRLIQFVFEGPIGNVSTGTDQIHLDLPELEWLYTQSVTELWRIETSRTTDANKRAALEELARWEANADKLRRSLTRPTLPDPLRTTVFRVI